MAPPHLLLKMMDWACHQIKNQCTTAYANSVHDALHAYTVNASGESPFMLGVFTVGNGICVLGTTAVTIWRVRKRCIYVQDQRDPGVSK